MPDSTDLVWPRRLLIFALLALGLGLLIQPVADPDVYIHLRDGRYWLESNLHVDKEPFAYTVPDKPFERTEWLFRVGAYLAWRMGGYNLLILLKAAVITAALFFLGMLAYRRWPNLGVVSLLLGLAVLAPATRLFPERPYIFTYLFLPISLLLLDDFRRAASRKIWWLVPLTALWSNLHPGFLVLFGFMGAQILDDGLAWLRSRDGQAKSRALTLLGVTAACLAAGTLNMQGPSIYAFVLNTMGTEDFMKYLVEWQPPRVSQEPVFFVLLAAVWLSVAADYRRLKLADLLPLLACTYLGLKSYRNIPLLLIAGLPVLAGHARALAGRFHSMRPWSPKARKLACGAGAALALVLLAVAAQTGYAFRGGEVAGFFPAGGLDWISRQAWQGRILTHDIWGGYTGWRTHGKIKVFMDGRMPTYGPALYSDYRKMIWGDAQQCLALLDRHQIEGLLVSPKNEQRLYLQLWQSGRWALIYWDDVCQFYVRRGGPNQPLVDQHEYRWVDPKRSPYFHPQHPEEALAEIARAHQTAPHSFLPAFFLGESYMRANRYDDAVAVFRQTLALAPAHMGTHYNLGLIAQERRQWNEAEHHFRSVLKIADQGPVFGKTAFLLATIIRENPYRRQEALALAKKAAAVLPTWPAAGQLVKELEENQK